MIIYVKKVNEKVIKNYKISFIIIFIQLQVYGPVLLFKETKWGWAEPNIFICISKKSSTRGLTLIRMLL